MALLITTGDSSHITVVAASSLHEEVEDSTEAPGEAVVGPLDRPGDEVQAPNVQEEFKL